MGFYAMLGCAMVVSRGMALLWYGMAICHGMLVVVDDMVVLAAVMI